MQRQMASLMVASRRVRKPRTRGRDAHAAGIGFKAGPTAVAAAARTETAPADAAVDSTRASRRDATAAVAHSSSHDADSSSSGSLARLMGRPAGWNEDAARELVSDERARRERLVLEARCPHNTLSCLRRVCATRHDYHTT